MQRLTTARAIDSITMLGFASRGGRCEMTNLHLTHTLLRIIGKPASLLNYVTDRLGHDRRYAIDCSKMEKELGWQPTIAFDEGLRQTVEWYQANTAWAAKLKK